MPLGTRQACCPLSDSTFIYGKDTKFREVMPCNFKELRMCVFSSGSLGKFFETQSVHLSFDARKTGPD